MIHYFSVSNHKKYFLPFLTNHYQSFLFILIAFLISCSPSERFTKKDETTQTTKTESTSSEVTKTTRTSEIRVLLNEIIQSELITIDSPVILSDSSKRIIHLTAGTRIYCIPDQSTINLMIEDKNFKATKFYLECANNEGIIKINGKMYHGRIQISQSESSIHLINIIGLEEYVKGVLVKEMPSGNNDNLEALKALAVCIRTYAIRKMQDGKIYFDLFSDMRDQVYGGADMENILSNKAVDETNNLILKYEDSVAQLYYHSTCGGYTESSENVFTKDPLPYLKSVKDGDEPFCKISPRFNWEEIYTKEKIIQRLKDYALLNDGVYQLNRVSVLNRFQSGRVRELEIIVANANNREKSLVLRGNEIRSILRTSDNKSILWSTMFDISTNSNTIILTGKGFGHGVGLCQWGAIAMSRKGYNYRSILQHYYPGTTISKFND